MNEFRNRSCDGLRNETNQLFRRVIKVFREEFPKEIEKFIIKEFGDLDEPYETLDLIEEYLEKINKEK